jgi:hypothetical protein
MDAGCEKEKARDLNYIYNLENKTNGFAEKRVLPTYLFT